MFHVIDDQPVLRSVLCELLESQGYQSMHFDSAELYLEYFHSPEFVAPAAILSDYCMPGKTGLELIKLVRARLPHQKAVIMTGNLQAHIEPGLENHLCFLLIKPYKLEQLFAVLQAQKSCQLSGAEFPMQCEQGLDHQCPFHTHQGRVGC